MERVVLGWREWLALPEMGISRIKAKVDTGARTSSLHCSHLRFFERDGVAMVSFSVPPLQRTIGGAVEVSVPLLERRHVRSSNGTHEVRPVIRTRVEVGGKSWPIEVTLTSRNLMGFRMLLGRQALRGKAVVDPQRSFLAGRMAEKP